MRKKKAAINISRTRTEKIKTQAEYTEVNKRVKRSIRTNKRKYVEDLALTAEKAFEYVKSIIDEHGEFDADVKARIGKAREAYIQLKNIGKSKQLSVN
ncbi:unnamed protein product [Schistosoma margrebowiei]|uniref:Uncharacterized protein n=1 Tax=Schistosoma margrebowiei TaxID=48269 RepID=A0A183LJJ4_9TREM|nr:unnamed protein product [Schistosoma margrebowiei]